MEKSLREVVDMIKDGGIHAAGAVREINKKIPIQGERHVAKLKGRDVDIAYYRASAPGKPLFIGMHGGGFITGGSAIDDKMWDAFCKAWDVNIASVDYRMGPVNKWPAGLLDVYETTLYLIDHVEEFGFDVDNIMIGGESAGGNLAATACIYAKQQGKDLYKKQILIYPYLDFASDPFARGSGGAFTPPAFVAMHEIYINEENYAYSTASPVCATLEELQGLPEAIVLLASEDVLCPEGKRYIGMLKEAGVSVVEKIFEGMPHAFIENAYAAVIPDMMMDDLTKATLEDGSMRAAAEEAILFVKENL